MLNLKNEIYIPLEKAEPGWTKKRCYDKYTTRCLQSKINLKFPIKEMLKDKSKPKLQIKEGVIKEFNKRY